MFDGKFNGCENNMKVNGRRKSTYCYTSGIVMQGTKVIMY